MNYSIKRRILQVSIFELVAIVLIAAGTFLLTSNSMSSSLSFAIINSIIAVIWNYIFNTVFEYWESLQTVKGRNLKRRIAHTILFEAGLIFLLVPFMAFWFKTTLITAFIADISIVVFFLLYSFSFNWLFDRIMGLPESAMG